MINLINLGAQSPANLFVPNGSIKFQLNVDGTIIAAPYGFVASDIPVVFQLDSNGNILPNAPATSAQIWSNLELDPQNSTGLGTYYLVTIYDQNGAALNQQPLWWQFPQANGSTVNISQMVPVATVGGNVIYYPIPVFAAGNNIFTGNNTFTGTNKFTGPVSAGVFNNFFFVDGTEFVNLAAAIAAAITAGGGTIFTAMPEVFTVDPFAGLGETNGPSIRVIFGPGTWSTRVPITVPALTQLIGAGRSLTKIQAVSGYAQGVGRQPTVFDVFGTVGTIISDMEIDAGNGATMGIYATDINENSGFLRLVVTNYSAFGIWVDAAGFWDEAAQTYFMEDIEAYCGAAGVTGTTIGVLIQGNGGGGPARIQDVTSNGQAGNIQAASLALTNFIGGFFNSIHGEFTTDVVTVGSTLSVNQVTLFNITAGNGAGTNVVHVVNASVNAFSIIGVGLGTYTNVINDVPRSVTLTDTFLSFYLVSAGATQTIITDSPSLPTITAGTTISLRATTPTVPSGQIGLGATTAATATAGSATLPSNPVKFWEINDGGTMRKIPLYNV